jgi:hypothetical protein
MIIERDGKFYQIIKKGSIENKPDGRHCIEETIEKEITELEYLRYKVRELEADISDLKWKSYPVVCPCPCPREVPVINPCPPWNPNEPIWYYDPYRPTVTCDTRGPTETGTTAVNGVHFGCR